MWTVGALFVPISFLIFAEAVVYPVTLFGMLLVAIASLACYEVWYRICLRSRALMKPKWVPTPMQKGLLG